MSKSVGIIGGIGPESTIIYYREIVRRFRELDKSGHYPRVILNCIDVSELLAKVAEKKYADVIDMLAVEIHKLELARVDYGIIGATTPHIVFDELISKVNLPLISIVEETCRAIKASGIYKIGLFGTSFTMQSDFFKNVAKRFHLDIIVPELSEQEYIHTKYVSEFIPGIVLNETRKGLLEIATALKLRTGIGGLILGGTELSLILKQADFPELTIFDSTLIHVESVVNRLLS